jgi:hypothetical protein
VAPGGMVASAALARIADIDDREVIERGLADLPI